MTHAELLLRHCPWMLEAMSLLGKREIPGVETAGFIAKMLKGLHAWWRDDETPWCGVFVAHCLKAAGQPIAQQWWRARGWEGFGVGLPRDASVRMIPYGALVVLSRPPNKANGHVGFFAGRVEHSHWKGGGVSLLGGNQDNGVSYASFPVERVEYWGWPVPAPLPPSVGAKLVGLANGYFTASFVAPSRSEA